VIIIATFGLIAEIQNEVRVPEPKVVFVDANNRITHTGREVPGPRRRGLDDAPVDDCC
jgi:aspartate 1-decarboxylase